MHINPADQVIHEDSIHTTLIFLEIPSVILLI